MPRNVSLYGPSRGVMGGGPIQRDYAMDPRRMMAQQLMQQGTSTAPVQSPLEGLTRSLTAGVGGYFGGEARREMQGRERGLNEDMLKVLAGAQQQPMQLPEGVQGPPAMSPGGYEGMQQALGGIDNPDIAPFAQQLGMQQVQQEQAMKLAEAQRAAKLQDAMKLKAAPAATTRGKYYIVPTGSGNMMVDKQNGMAVMLGVGPDGSPVQIGEPFRPMMDSQGQPTDVPEDVGAIGSGAPVSQAQPTPAATGPQPLMPPSLAAGAQAKVAGAKEEAVTEVKRRYEAKDVEAKLGGSFAPLDRMETNIDDILTSQGLEARTGLSSYVPATLQGDYARDTQALMTTMKSQIAQNVLQMYRQMSTTGGAVGQVSNFEQEMFQNNLAALDQAQTIEQFKRELGKIKTFVSGSKQRIVEAYNKQYAGDSIPSLEMPGSAPSGATVSSEDQQAMEWAQSNPNDPRAAAIMSRLGGQ